MPHKKTILTLKAPFMTIVAFVGSVDQNQAAQGAAWSLIYTVHYWERLCKKAAVTVQLFWCNFNKNVRKVFWAL